MADTGVKAMAFFKAPDGRKYVSRKAYRSHLIREQRRIETARRKPVTDTIPQRDQPRAAPGSHFLRREQTGKRTVDRFSDR